jgi:hypothetical protein
MAEDTFSSIAAGYGGAQSTLVRLGLLPGSFAPTDQTGGSAVQLPSPPPPIFTTQLSHTSPFPAMSPMLAGAAAPPPPQLLHPLATNISRSNMPSSIVGAPHIQASMQLAQGGGGGGAGFAGGSPIPQWGMPAAAPVWSKAFTNPMMGPSSSPVGLSGGSFWGDAAMSGMAPGALNYSPPPPTGMSILQQRAAASRRMMGRAESYAQTALDVGSLGASIVGGLGGLAGSSLGAAAGLAAAPLGAAAMWGSAYSSERAGIRGVEDVFAGMRVGGMTSATGRGIDPRSAASIYQGLDKQSTDSYAFTTQDYMSTMAMGEQSGLMRGHTGSTDQVVSRVKELAKATKAIMDLGEGLTQTDAIELQALTRQMGVSSGRFQAQDMGKKITAAARAAGMTLPGFMSGFGQEGASTYAQMGMNAGSGLLMGGTAMSQAAGMVDSGSISDRRLSALGGISGFATHLLRGSARAQARGAGSMMLGSLTEDGGFDREAFEGMAYGRMSLSEANKAGRKTLKGKNLTQRQRELRSGLFTEQSSDVFNEMQEDLSPEMQQAFVIRQAQRAMGEAKKKGKGLTMMQALTGVTGSREDALAYQELVRNPGAVDASAQQSRLIERDRGVRAQMEAADRFSFFGRMSRSADKGAHRLKEVLGIKSAAAGMAGYDAEAMEDAVGGPGRGGRGPSKKWLAEMASGETDIGAVIGKRDNISARRGSNAQDFKYSEGAVDALEELGYGGYGSDTGRWLGLQGGSDDKFQRDAREASSAIGVFREADRFGASKGGARNYVRSAGRGLQESTGLSGDVIADVLSSYRGTVRDAVKQRIGGNKQGRLFNTDSAKAKAQEIVLADYQKRTGRSREDLLADPTVQGQIRKVQGHAQLQMGAEVHRMRSGTEDERTAVGAYAQDVRDVEDTLGLVGNASNVGATAKGDFQGGADDAIAMTNAMRDAGLTDKEEIQLYMDTGGDTDKLQRILDGGDSTKSRAAEKLLDKVSGKHGAKLRSAHAALDKSTTAQSRNFVKGRGGAVEMIGGRMRKVGPDGSYVTTSTSTIGSRTDDIMRLMDTQENSAQMGMISDSFKNMGISGREALLSKGGFRDRASSLIGKTFSTKEEMLNDAVGSEGSSALLRSTKGAGSRIAQEMYSLQTGGDTYLGGQSREEAIGSRLKKLASLGVAAGGGEKGGSSGGAAGRSELKAALSDMAAAQAAQLKEAFASALDEQKQQTTAVIGAMDALTEKVTSWW